MRNALRLSVSKVHFWYWLLFQHNNIWKHRSNQNRYCISCIILSDNHKRLILSLANKEFIVFVFQCIWSNYGILRNLSENHEAAYLLAHPVFAIQRTGSEWPLGGNGCESYCTLPRRIYGIFKFCGGAPERTGTYRENIVRLGLISTVLCPAHIV